MKVDLENQNNRLVIAALVNMVESEGLTVRETYKRIDDIKNEIYFALKEVEQQKAPGDNGRKEIQTATWMKAKEETK